MRIIGAGTPNILNRLHTTFITSGDLNCYQNIMYTNLAIITTKRIKATKKRTYQNSGKYVSLVTYVSEPQRLGMVLSTLYGEGRARLAGNNYSNYVVFQVSFKFPSSLFRKTVVSTQKTVHNKAPDQVLPFSDNSFFENEAANSGHSRAAQPNCSENRFVEKTNKYRTCCFGILHGTICHICPLGVHLAET